MSNEQKLLDLENGGVLVVRKTEEKSNCFWQALCATAVLGLLTVSSYLILCQLGVLPSNQKVTLNSGNAQIQDLRTQSVVMTSPGNSGQSHHMMQVGNDPRRKIAAHLTASQSIEGKNVIWQNEADSTLSEGVEFKDNRLVIKTPGLYFVYTQVVFFRMGCQGQPIFLSHELSKLSASYPEESLLLKATKSTCHYGKHGEPWYKTSYQGAIFEFEEGDQIFSRVNEEVVGYVDTAEGKSFFGIFAL
ncbi:tumor necrosis factor-like [Heptranchias perlo]|uniref:tumor necrosis factor-like n=1 Tax=Heptranchias perlo TaxID=212740 RepID=UPI003559A70B